MWKTFMCGKLSVKPKTDRDFSLSVSGLEYINEVLGLFFHILLCFLDNLLCHGNGSVLITGEVKSEVASACGY